MRNSFSSFLIYRYNIPGVQTPQSSPLRPFAPLKPGAPGNPSGPGSPGSPGKPRSPGGPPILLPFPGKPLGPERSKHVN